MCHQVTNKLKILSDSLTDNAKAADFHLVDELDGEELPWSGRDDGLTHFDNGKMVDLQTFGSVSNEII